MKNIKSNKGFTLFELIVVMAIGVILTGILAISINYVHNANVTAAANKLDAAINTARVKSMTQGPDAGELTIYVDNGILYAQIGTGAPEVISKSPVVASYYSGNSEPGTAGTYQGSIVTITLRFNSAGSVIESESTNVSKFDFTKGDKHAQVILVPETGKHGVRLY